MMVTYIMLMIAAEMYLHWYSNNKTYLYYNTWMNRQHSEVHGFQQKQPRPHRTHPAV